MQYIGNSQWEHYLSSNEKIILTTQDLLDMTSEIFEQSSQQNSEAQDLRRNIIIEYKTKRNLRKGRKY